MWISIEDTYKPAFNVVRLLISTMYLVTAIAQFTDFFPWNVREGLADLINEHRGPMSSLVLLLIFIIIAKNDLFKKSEFTASSWPEHLSHILIIVINGLCVLIAYIYPANQELTIRLANPGVFWLAFIVSSISYGYFWVLIHKFAKEKRKNPSNAIQTQ